MNNYYCKDIYRFYKINGGKLSYSSFKSIIAEHNKLVSNLIMDTGYHFHIPHFLGIIRIFRTKRHIKINEAGNIVGAVNWGESNKLKAKLIEEGKTPYETIKDNNGKVISDNGGEKWLVYHVDEFYYNWGHLHDVMLHNSWNYRFTASWHNARALIAGLTENSEFLYKDTQGNNAANRLDFVRYTASKSGKNVQLEQQQLES